MPSFDTARRRPLRSLVPAATLAVAALVTASGVGPTAAAATPSAATPSAAWGSTVAADPAAARAAGVVPGSSACGTPAAGAVTCTLYATAGSITVSSAAIPVWNFVAGAADAVTGTGPVLVVDQGATVTINLVNNLTTNVSLAVPGTSLKDDTTGAAAGASKAYTFTANRPGTFLYEAGHTANGPRQVAMGLVGALIVRPTGFDPAAATDVNAGSGFDDEAVLVLTDVDPGLNAAPLTYDLRNFHATYRLINGKAFPETDPILTSAGKTVLLRYLNAGMVSHAMGTLGLSQRVVAIDAYPGEADTLVADTLPAGQTEDALVAVPSSFTSKTVVYDTSGALDNGGKIDASSIGGTLATTTRQVAFGGLMTLLDASGTGSTSGDTVGPTSTITAVTPNPASVAQDLTVTASFADPTVAGQPGPSNLKDAELLLDGDISSVSVGSSPYRFTIPAGTSSSASGLTATIPAAALQARNLAQGTHTVYVRAQDSSDNWGAPVSKTFTLAVSGAVTSGVTVSPDPVNGVASLTNPGGGVTVSATGDAGAVGGTVLSATATLGGKSYPMTLTPGGSAVTGESVAIPSADLAALPEGTATVSVTSTDSVLQIAGPAATGTFVLDRTGPTASGGSVTPTPTNGTVGSAVDSTSLQVSASFTDGTATSPASTMVAAEGFLESSRAVGNDTFPGACTVGGQACVDGHGFVFVAADGVWDKPTENAYGLIPLTELTGYSSGTYTVWVHGKDAAGTWGPTAAVTFVVDRTGPTVAPGFTFAQTGNGTGTLAASATDALGTVAAAEYYLGADPGAGNGKPLTVGASAIGRATTVSGTLTGLPLGLTDTVYVRARDGLGNWGTARALTPLAVLQEPIFADSFGTTGSTWTGQPWTVTGGPTRVAANGLAMDGARAMLTANNSAASTVTTPVMNTATNPASARYNARFEFRPNSLNPSGTTGYVTIFSARSGTTERVGVQYHRNGANAQLRLVVGGTAFGSWYTLGGTGATYTVRVAWASGGNAVLYANPNPTQGPTVRQTMAAAAGLTVDRAVLGTTAPSSGTVSGQAYFDYYQANRFSVPQ